jgi:uncharacterized protein (DUF433 family)
MNETLLNRITINPGIMEGKPMIKGTRLSVEQVRRLIIRGATVAEICEDYPGLVAEDILACLLYPSIDPSSSGTPGSGVFDLGHQGDVDYTQIRQLLALTPEERLEHHESWREFVKEALSHAEVRQGNDRPPCPGTS